MVVAEINKKRFSIPVGVNVLFLVLPYLNGQQTKGGEYLIIRQHV